MTQADWGSVTPEGYNESTKEALHVLNVNLIGDANKTRVVRFICARVLHYDRHLPEGTSQQIRFDLRGQFVGNKALYSLRQSIVDECSSKGIQVSVEFLTN